MAITNAERQAIVSSYQAENPTPLTSQVILRQVAKRLNLGQDSVRNVLVRAGVYVNVPKGKSHISKEDGATILSALKAFEPPEDYDEFFEARLALYERLAYQYGYTWYAICKFSESHAAIQKHPRQLELEAEAEKRHLEWKAEYEAKRAQETKHIASQFSGLRSGPRRTGGPDALGWVFIIVVSLLVATCVSSIDPDAGKSDVQKTCEKSLAPLGFDC